MQKFYRAIHHSNHLLGHLSSGLSYPGNSSGAYNNDRYQKNFGTKFGFIGWRRKTRLYTATDSSSLGLSSYQRRLCTLHVWISPTLLRRVNSDVLKVWISQEKLARLTERASASGCWSESLHELLPMNFLTFTGENNLSRHMFKALSLEFNSLFIKISYLDKYINLSRSWQDWKQPR